MAPELNVYGIRSCDTCRKACKWLEEQGIEYRWVDLREQLQTRATLRCWLDSVGAERLVNRRSITWRGLDEQQRPAPDSPDLPSLLRKHPTLIKRPVFERSGEIRAGFDEDARRWLLQE